MAQRLPLFLGAQKRGLDVSIALHGAAQNELLKNNNLRGLDIAPAIQKAGLKNMLQIIRSAVEIIQTEKPDLIHTITLKYAFLIGLAARLVRLETDHEIRCIYTIAGLGYLFSDEGLKPKILRLIVRPLLKLALDAPGTHLIFQNPDDKNHMIDQGFARAENCHLIYGSGVDLKRFPATPLPSNETPVILMPTRLLHQKGISIFIKAARLLHKKGVNARFQLAGGLTHNNPLAITREELDTMLMDSPVEWLGKVEDMPALYQNVSLICYPSYYREGIPRILLEAAASARPVITTDHPGCREGVREGKNGLLIPIKDAQALANAIEALINNPQKMAEMALEARKLAEDIFAMDKIVEQTLDVYESAQKV